MSARKSTTIFFVLAGLNSLATTYFGNYIFFLLRDRFHFGPAGNLATAAVGGLVYALASWQGGRFAQRFGYLSSLKVGLIGMAGCLMMGGAIAALPAILLAYAGWMLAMCFTWPPLEALVCDGLAEGHLPRNVGIYNVVWSSTMAAMFFCGGTLYELLGRQSIFWLPPLVHAGQLLVVLCLGKDSTHRLSAEKSSSSPDAALTGTIAQSESGPRRDALSPHTFLRMAWLAIPFSYVGITTVNAVIPAIATALRLSTAQAGLFCSVWMFVRLGTFIALWQWTGWHYRFGWLLGGFVGLTASFSLLLLSGSLGPLVAAQVGFGISIGLIYYSSLFYSMDVGETKGEHGGLHEAMIGMGSCLGPAVGALSLCLMPGVPNAGAYAVTGVLACGLAGLIGLRVRRSG